MGDVRHNIIYMLRTLLIENQKDGSLVSVTAKDGSFLAIGFRNNACEVTPEQSQDEKESTEEEIDIEGADHKSLEHLLGQDQCFYNNFDGVLGNKTKRHLHFGLIVVVMKTQLTYLFQEVHLTEEGVESQFIWSWDGAQYVYLYNIHNFCGIFCKEG